MRVRWAATAAILALGLVTMLWYAGRGGRPGPRPASPVGASPPAPAVTSRPSPAATLGRTSLPPISLEEGRITAADAAGRLQWELRAQTVETSVDRQEVRLVRVEGKFFEGGALVATLAAPRAVFSLRTQDLTLTGGVRARAPGGRTLEAQRVEWVAVRRLLVASGGVRLVQERMTVRADRLESDIGLRRTRLIGNIRVVLRE